MASASSSRPGSANGSDQGEAAAVAQPARTVTYKRYEPSLKNRRVSQLSHQRSGFTASGLSIGSEATAGSPPTRVLGAANAVSSGSARQSTPSVEQSRTSYATYTHSPRSSVSSSHDGSLAAGTPPSMLAIHMASQPTSTTASTSSTPSQTITLSAQSGSGDYFVPRHSESTAPAINTRQRERDSANGNGNGYNVSNTSSPFPTTVEGGLPVPGSTGIVFSMTPSSLRSNASSTVHTPAIPAAAGGGGHTRNGSNHLVPTMPVLQTGNSSSSVASAASGTSSQASTSSAGSTSAAASASTLHPLPYAAYTSTSISPMTREPAFNFARSHSAMAALQPGSARSGSPSTSAATSPPGSSSGPPTAQQPLQYRAFVPPSAYVARQQTATASTASSPGVGQSVGQNVASHITSALARGLNNVNGVVNGNGSVRLPQSASSVANAVWNRLPPAFQALKDEVADSAAIPGMQGFGNSSTVSDNGNGQRASTPPSAYRSQSVGSINPSYEVRRSSMSTGQSPGLGTSGISIASSVNGSQHPPQPPPLVQQSHSTPHLRPEHTPAMPLAAQLRLDVANKQLQGVQIGVSSNAPITAPPRQKAPYKPGYQPKNGVSRAHTESFLALREAKAAMGRGLRQFEGTGVKPTLEEERLMRRLDKLIELHFPAPKPTENDVTLLAQMTRSGSDMSVASSAATASPAKPSSLRRTSDIFGRVVNRVGSMAIGGEPRVNDQSIVKWQEDADVQRCPICFAPFNLITRKHHCRLCGRVVCFLPPNASGSAMATGVAASPADNAPSPAFLPTRTRRCSTFIVYDRYNTAATTAEKDVLSSALAAGFVREVDLGASDAGSAGTAEDFHHALSRERVASDAARVQDLKKGVRICQDCLSIITKRQKKIAPKRNERWITFYQHLTDLQAEIEEALTSLSTLRSTTPATVEVVKAFNSQRKTILQHLSSYDLIAKRIRDLPVANATHTPSGKILPAGVVSSQERLQKAIYNRAALFVGEKMAVIKGMGSVQLDTAYLEQQRRKKNEEEEGRSKSSLNSSNVNKSSPVRNQKEEEERTARLAVLYEQEALVSGYLEDANARRQFEDALALKASLEELRDEIQGLLE